MRGSVHAIGAASVIVDERGRVLLVKHGYGRLNWEVPGGAGEEGESAEQIAVREAREEAGIDLSIVRLTGVYWEADHPGSPGMHHFVFLAHLAPGSPLARVADEKEITDYGWFAPDALPRPMNDFTARRIDDALSDRPATFASIGPRAWLT